MFHRPEEQKILEEIQTIIASLQVDLASMIANCKRIIDRQPCFNPPKIVPVGVNQPSVSMAGIRTVHDEQLEIAPVAASQPEIEQDLASVPTSNTKVDKNGSASATMQSSVFLNLVDNEGTSSPKIITPTVFNASSAIATIAHTITDDFESPSTREYLCLSEFGYISFLQSPLQRNFMYNHFKKIQCQSLVDRVPDPKAILGSKSGHGLHVMLVVGRGPHVMVKINTKAVVTIYSLLNLDGRPPPALFSYWKYNLLSLIQYVLERPRTDHQAALPFNGVSRTCCNVARLFPLSRPYVELQNNAPMVKLQTVLSNCLSLVDSILLMVDNYANTFGNCLDGIITVQRANVEVSIRVICTIHNIQVAFLIFGLVLVSAAKDEFVARLDVPIAWVLYVANRNRKALNEICSCSDCSKSIGMVLISSSFSCLHSMNFSHLGTAVHIHSFKCPVCVRLLKSLTAMVVDLLGFLPVVFKGGTALPKVLIRCQLLVVISGNRVVQSKASTPTVFDSGGGVFVALCLVMKNGVYKLMVLVDDAPLGKSLYDRDSGIYYGQLYQILADPITSISPMLCLNAYEVLIFLHKLGIQSSIMQILEQEIYGDDDVHCLFRNLNWLNSKKFPITDIDLHGFSYVCSLQHLYISCRGNNTIRSTGITYSITRNRSESTAGNGFIQVNREKLGKSVDHCQKSKEQAVGIMCRVDIFSKWLVANVLSVSPNFSSALFEDLLVMPKSASVVDAYRKNIHNYVLDIKVICTMCFMFTLSFMVITVSPISIQTSKAYNCIGRQPLVMFKVNLVRYRLVREMASALTLLHSAQSTNPYLIVFGGCKSKCMSAIGIISFATCLDMEWYSVLEGYLTFPCSSTVPLYPFFFEVY